VALTLRERLRGTVFGFTALILDLVWLAFCALLTTFLDANGFFAADFFAVVFFAVVFFAVGFFVVGFAVAG
jgi:hypothetical protein